MTRENAARRSLLGVLATVVLVACDEGPVSLDPTPRARLLVTAYECAADVRSGVTTCRVQPVDAANGSTFNIIAGSPSVSFTTSGAVISNGRMRSTLKKFSWHPAALPSVGRSRRIHARVEQPPPAAVP
jgi:hypothetical protein